MKRMENTNLNEIVGMIRENKLLLPDFQRGFVWDLEMQKGLVASVLAKMPLGSILELEAKADDYGCRILGRKDDVLLEDKQKEVLVLLDGQQRLTSLINAFSNLIYYDYENPPKLIRDYRTLLSPKLSHRFFLRIPAVWKGTKEKGAKDWFGLKELKMNIGSSEKDIPPFLTKDILEWIHTEKITKKSTEPYAPHSDRPQEIVKYCKKENEYWIPLYLLIEEKENSDINRNRLQDILDDIVDDTVKYYVREEYRKISGRQEKIHYIEQHLATDHIKDVIESEDMEETFQSEWISKGKRSWSERMVAYLKGCIERMDMHEIGVEQSQRERAIDIYENLNLGGVTLSTFELILAKAAKKKFTDSGNLYDAVVELIQSPMEYEEKLLAETITKKHFKILIEEQKEYAVLEAFGCYDEKKNILNKKFTEVFLNVLTLISRVPDYDPEKIEGSLIKRGTTLKLDENNIWGNYEKVCKGIARACFFLQARCGIRKIGGLNYNLMLVLLAYLLAEDKYCENEEIVKQLEVWYWLSIFSGRYDKDQSENIISDIRNFLVSIQKKDNYKWMKGWEKTFFNMPGFSDKETLLMKGDEPPKKVIKDTICQFYLSVTYPDIMNNEITIQPFWISGQKLEEHHIVPIGSMKSTYKKCAEEIRKNKKSVVNSPLNYVYITEESNKKISSRLLRDYIDEATDGSKHKLKIEPRGTESIDTECVREFLEGRFISTRTEIAERINSMACWEGRLNVEDK